MKFLLEDENPFCDVKEIQGDLELALNTIKVELRKIPYDLYKKILKGTGLRVKLDKALYLAEKLNKPVITYKCGDHYHYNKYIICYPDGDYEEYAIGLPGWENASQRRYIKQDIERLEQRLKNLKFRYGFIYYFGIDYIDNLVR